MELVAGISVDRPACAAGRRWSRARGLAALVGALAAGSSGVAVESVARTIPVPGGQNGQIAFYSNRATPDQEVWLMGADGSAQTRVPGVEGASELAPVFSP